MSSSFIVLTGMPGCGKSTLIKKIVTELRASSMINLKGFYTEERRNSENERIGFDIKTFDGTEGVLARISSSSDVKSNSNQQKSTYIVGKYTVYVNEFENLCLKYINSLDEESLLIIDEIGKMELLSTKFEKAIKAILSSKSNLKVLTTVPLKSTHQLIDRIKTQKNSTLFHITKSNRDALYEKILNKVKDMM